MKKWLGMLVLSLLAHAATAQQKVFDNHVHIWEGEKSVKEYLAQVAGDGLTVTRFGGIHMARLGEPEETRRKNDELIALSKKYPQLMPIPSVHPYDNEAALTELRRLAGQGVKAIKIHPHTQKFDVTDPRVPALCKLAGELGIVVMMDNANIIPGDSENLFNLAVAVPGTKFLFAHMGALNFRFWNIIPLVRTTKGFWSDNIYFDLSAVSYIGADSPIEPELLWTIRNVGVDRVIVGSDFPQLSLAQSLGAFEKLDLTKEEKDKIRYENARKLFGL